MSTQKRFSSLDELKAAIDRGGKVFHHHEGYPVIKDSIGQYLITFPSSEGCWGLTWQDGVTLNGKLEEFFELVPDPDLSVVIERVIPLSEDGHATGFRDALEMVVQAMGGDTPQTRAVVRIVLDRYVEVFG